MPRMQDLPAPSKEVVIARPPESLIASAAQYGDTNFKDFGLISSTQDSAWQEEAWRFYRIIGEFRYSCDWVGGQLSKALIHATVYRDGRVQEVESTHAAAKVIDEIFDDPDGRAEMFRLLGVHFTVAGEAVLMVYPDPERNDESDTWRVLASTEVRNRGNRDVPVWYVHGKPLPEEIDQDAVRVIRLWRADPKNPDRAISPACAVLSTLGEIERLTDHLAAQIDSRLAGAGILMMPSDIQLPTPTIPDGAKVMKLNTADEVMAVLHKVMSASIARRGTASATVPIVMTCPAEVIDKVQHLTFWSELDEHVIDMRNEAIRRLALGMDMPPEVLQGISDSNHWSAWQADESSIKAHTEPLLKIITSSLAEGVLRPALRDMVETGELPADTIVEHYSIGADTSEMRLRPNRSKEALELYELGLIKMETVIRETGFEAEDMMDDEGRKTWLLMKLASASATPEILLGALERLGVELPALPAAVVEEQRGTEDPPSLEEHPTQEIPDYERSVRRKEARERGDVPSAQAAALVAAADQIVVRALERAGNKLKTAKRVGDGGALTSAATLYRVCNTDDMDLDYLLQDAWAHVPVVAERYDMNPDALVASLEGYCRQLLETKAPHEYEQFEHWMNSALEGIRS